MSRTINAVVLAAVAASAPAIAQEASPAATKNGPNGGVMALADGLQIETLAAADGIRVYATAADGSAVDLTNARGVGLLSPASQSKRYRFDLFGESLEDGGSVLVATADLSRFAGDSADLELQLIGLPEQDRRPLTVTTKLDLPVTETQEVAAAIADQKVCPVSDQPLGSMGKPLPVTLGDRTIYVCCAACVDSLESNPGKYLPAPVSIASEPVTEADDAKIAAQKSCPVMDEPLGSMGTPLKVTGLGRDVFLCCKGCLKFLKADPAKYLANLPPAPAETKPSVTKAGEADGPFVAAQQRCPVMDEPLDAMGGPYRVVVDGRVVYLCCPGCAKKLQSDPRAYLKKLASQGVTAPTIW